MKPFFKDEKPQNSGANWYVPGIQTGSGSALPDGGSANWEKPETTLLKGEWVYPEGEYTPRPDMLLLRRSSGGRLMVDRKGCLTACKQQCVSCPAIIVYLKREKGSSISELSHRDCIQINLNYRLLRPLLNEPEKTLHYELWPRESKRQILVTENGYEVPMYLGNFPLPDPGEVLDITAKWQEGHYNIRELAKMRFQVFGKKTSWVNFPLDKWQKVCTVKMDDGKIKVDERTAKLQGNKLPNPKG